MRFPTRQVSRLVATNGAVAGVSERMLEPSSRRGALPSRGRRRLQRLHAGAVIVTSGGIGGNP